jgi:hypothetical protein
VKVALDALGENGWAPPDVVLAMAAELRAAREVVEALRSLSDGVSNASILAVMDSLNAYDQAVGGGDL